MSFLDTFSKLQKMSSDEILFRVRQQVYNRRELFHWKFKGKTDLHELFIPDDVRTWNYRRYEFPFREIAFFGLSGDRQALREAYIAQFPEAYQQCRREAEKLLEHRFHFLGLDVTLPDPIPWNRNPQTGKDYPMVHFTMVDTFNTEKYGDVKYVWELNRHQFFIDMAKAYFLTGDERYANKIWLWLESFIKAVPYKIGINHTSVLEHAMRIFSWVWAYYLTQDSPVWTPPRQKALVQQLLMQGSIIEKNLSFFYSPYNHLIGELAALTFLGTVYGNSPKMGIWRDKYWRDMEKQLEKQLHGDGFTVEQASYYHHFTIGFYLMLVQLRRQNGLPVAQKTLDLLERSLEFPMYLTRPDGQLPMLGDIDSARSIYFYRPAPQWNLRPFQALGAAIFQRGDMKHAAGAPAEELLWLLGSEGYESFEKLPAELPKDTSRPYRQSGYFIMRDGWEAGSSYCCFDCGEIAHGVFKDETPSAAHGHGDILSFELCLEGQPLVIDPGFYTYFGDEQWHRYFRDTRGHNAISVNNAGQALHAGRITWSNVASPRFDDWVSTAELDFAGGAIDRFSGLEETVVQRRYLLFRKGRYFLVMDEVSGSNTRKPFEVESSLHFYPGELTEQDNGLIYNGRSVARLALPPAASLHIANGQDRPDGGWMATGYGCRTPAPVLRIRVTDKLPLHLGMLFPLESIREDQTLSLQQRQVDVAITAYRIQCAEGEETVYLNPLRRKFVLGGKEKIETDALCVIERHEHAKEIEFRFIKVNHLQKDGTDVHSQLTETKVAGLKIFANQLDKPNVESWK